MKEFKHRCDSEEERRSNLLVVNYIRLLRYARNHMIVLFLVLISLFSYGTIHTVKQDGSGNYTTIQAGINGASTGDTVLVWPGIYFENIDYNSKSITVASLFLITQDDNYIHTTIIDGGNNESCVAIINCEGISTTLCGFNIQHGSGFSDLKNGGGIYIDASFISIKNCIIKDNIARYGGGIFGQYSNIYLSGSTIKENRAIVNSGGILIIYNTQLNFDTLDFNSIFLNHGPRGCDFTKSANCPSLKIILDTGSVLIPDNFFYYTYNNLGYPVNDITWEINHGKIEQINADLYVNPGGDNENNGLSPNEPLQTIAYAIMKAMPDTVNPKTIHLSAGIYSPSNNNEIYPIDQRSYVSLQGSELDSSIIDAEHVYPLYYSKIFNSNFSINNISLKHGNDNNDYIYGIVGGLQFVVNENVQLYKLNILETNGKISSALISNKSNITLSKSIISHNSGGYPLVLANTNQGFKKMVVENTDVCNNGPGNTFEEGYGGAVGFLGSYSYPNDTEGRLTNVLISNNTLTVENANKPVCGLSCSQNAKVDVINTSIGNNIVSNPESSAEVFAGEGAEINFYNSIIYGTENYEIFLGDGLPTSYIATINLSNTNVKGGEENIQNWNNIHSLNWLEENIDANPLWTGTGDFPYSLQPGSPCINAGVPMFEEGMSYPYIKDEDGKFVLYMLDGDTVTLPATDLAGNPRISGGRIDMGAYEWQDTTTNIISLPQSSVSELSVSPNPFTSNTFISFKTTKESFITINVLNLNGQHINTITENNYPSGTYRLVWDGHDHSGFPLHSGTYLICLYSNGTLQSVTKANKINPK